MTENKLLFVDVRFLKRGQKAVSFHWKMVQMFDNHTWSHDRDLIKHHTWSHAHYQSATRTLFCIFIFVKQVIGDLFLKLSFALHDLSICEPTMYYPSMIDPWPIHDHSWHVFWHTHDTHMTQHNIYIHIHTYNLPFHAQPWIVLICTQSFTRDHWHILNAYQKLENINTDMINKRNHQCQTIDINLWFSYG